MEPPKTILDIADFFRRLPSVGSRSALRMAYACLSLPREDLETFSHVLQDALTKVHRCPTCGLLIDVEKCPICSDPKRDSGLLMVVTSPKDVLAVEACGAYSGKYFVLDGTISLAQHRTLESTGVSHLVATVKKGGIREVICCTGNDLEGDTTALLIGQCLRDTGVKITRPASGLPSGAVLEYADPATLSKAIQGRVKVSEDKEE